MDQNIGKNQESFQEYFQDILKSQIDFLEFTGQVQLQTLRKLADLLAGKAPNIKDIISSKKEISLYDYYSLTRRDDVMISYKGPVTDIILSEISRDIRNKLADNPKISKKLFSVFIELAQNILYYSSEEIFFADKRDRVGTILITQAEDHFTFGCGNMVENKYINDLVESCNKINSLDREELREYKRETRSSPKKDRSKGAGIGLIQVALTSGNPLQVEAHSIDDKYSFFSISVIIDKEVPGEAG
ncbi:MAG: SiaB family protein kinase [Microscillaceae bacterium]|nr:SiaB family protein kinase [Microscillaceae bacterium]